MSKEIVLRTLFGELRSPNLIDLKPLHRELRLLGLSATDDELLALKAIAESVPNLEEGVRRLKEVDAMRLEEIAGEQAAMMAEKRARADEAKRSEEEMRQKMKLDKQAADQEAKRIKNEESLRIENQRKIEAEAQKNARLAVQFSNPASYISDYKILKDPTAYGLEKQVASAIQTGWSPLGGICTYPMFAKVGFTAQDLFYQAMIKYNYMK